MLINQSLTLQPKFFKGNWYTIFPIGMKLWSQKNNSSRRSIFFGFFCLWDQGERDSGETSLTRESEK